jgi:hypothetical protein
MFGSKKQLVLIKNPDNTTCYVIKHNNNNNIKPEILLEKEIIQKNNHENNNHENIVLNILEKSDDVPIENDIKIMSNDINNFVIETNNIIHYEEDIILRKNIIETPVVETPVVETPVVETPHIETKMSNLIKKMLNNIQIPETQDIQKNISCYNQQSASANTGVFIPLYPVWMERKYISQTQPGPTDLPVEVNIFERHPKK